MQKDIQNKIKLVSKALDTFVVRRILTHQSVGQSSIRGFMYPLILSVRSLAIEELKDNGVWVYALDMDGEEMYKTNLKGNIALVIGNEGSGVKRLTEKLCDATISIPMFGNVNSLNASVSAGIATYEVLRQRRS